MSSLLTKEEILKSIHSEKVINWDKVFRQNPSIIESAYEAMDKWGEIKWKEAQQSANRLRVEQHGKDGKYHAMTATRYKK